ACIDIYYTYNSSYYTPVCVIISFYAIFLNFVFFYLFYFFFFNDTATTEIYTLSLHDALPICDPRVHERPSSRSTAADSLPVRHGDRKSTRLNSSHLGISYAVFCLKKKNTNNAGAGIAGRPGPQRPGDRDQLDRLVAVQLPVQHDAPARTQHSVRADVCLLFQRP